MVHVYDKSELRDMTLLEYIDWQIENSFFKDNTKVLHKNMSWSQDWATVTSTSEVYGLELYTEQIFQLKDDRFYGIQYTGKLLETNPTLRDDVEKIMNSFKILP